MEAHQSKDLVFSCSSLPEFTSDIIYVGRPRPVPVPGIITTTDDWGNPFRMLDGSDATERRRVLDCYKMYLLSRPDMIAKARLVLRGKRLACWCAPLELETLQTHAHILCSFANSLSSLEFMEHIKRGGAAAAAAIEQYSYLGIDLNFDIDPDPENRLLTGSTAAGIAAKAGHFDILNMFVQKKEVDLNKGRGTSSCLLLAAAYGHVDCVRLLMQHVASGRVDLSATRRDGVSALTIACQQGNAAVVRLLLLKKDGRFNKLKVSQRTLFPERVTPLLLSIRSGSLECVQLLLEHPGLSLDDNLYQRQSPVDIARSMHRQDIVQVLQSETNMESKSSSKNEEGAGALGGEMREENETEREEEEEMRPPSSYSGIGMPLPRASSFSSQTTCSSLPPLSLSNLTIPSKIQMNRVCRRTSQTQSLPVEVCDWIRQQYHTEVKDYKSMTKGWHEIYVLTLINPASKYSTKRLMLRIYRNQLSYWKLNEIPISAALEVQAANICKVANVPTPLVLASGQCYRNMLKGAEETLQVLATWSLSEFVENFSSGRKNTIVIRTDNTLSILRALYLFSMRGVQHSSSDLNKMNTSAIPGFHNYMEHLDYLDEVSRRYSGGCLICQHLVSKLKQMFHDQNVPVMRACLIHYDLHDGNVSQVSQRTRKKKQSVQQKQKQKKKKTRKSNIQTTAASCEGIRAVVDWEFGGIVDPRFDLIKYTMEKWNSVRHARRREMKERKKKAFQKKKKRNVKQKGGGSGRGRGRGSDSDSDNDSSGSDSGCDSGSGSGSSGSSSSSSDSEDEFDVNKEEMQRMWENYGKRVYDMSPTRLGPWFPFAAFRHVIEVVFYRAIIRLLSDGAIQRVPFCDFGERAEDARDSAKWLVDQGFLDLSKYPAAFSMLY